MFTSDRGFTVHTKWTKMNARTGVSNWTVKDSYFSLYPLVLENVISPSEPRILDSFLEKINFAYKCWKANHPKLVCKKHI